MLQFVSVPSDDAVAATPGKRHSTQDSHAALTPSTRGRRQSMAASTMSSSQHHQHASPNLRRFRAHAWLVVAVHRLQKFVRGPAAMTRTERRQAEALYFKLSPIVTMREFAGFLLRLGYTAADDHAIRSTFFQRATFAFDGASRPLAQREALKVAALVKRLQHDDYIESLKGGGDAANVLSALKATLSERKRADATAARKAALGSAAASRAVSQAATPQALSLEAASATPRSSALRTPTSLELQQQQQDPALTMRSLRRVVRETLGVDIAPAGGSSRRPGHRSLAGTLRAGQHFGGGSDDDDDDNDDDNNVDDTTELGESDVAELLKGPPPKTDRSRQHRRRRMSVSAKSAADSTRPGGLPLIATAATGDGIGAVGSSATVAADDDLASPMLADEDDSAGPTSRGFAHSSHGRDHHHRHHRSGFANDSSVLYGSDGEEDTLVATEARHLKAALAGIDEPAATQVRLSAKAESVARTERGPSRATGRLFPKLHHRVTTYTMAEFEQVLDAQTRKEKDIAYVERKKPNCTVAFAGAKQLGRYTSVEAVAGRNSDEVTRLAELRRSHDDQDHDLSPAAREARRREREEAVERQRQVTERLRIRHERPITRELPAWKQAWKQPRKLANIPNPCRHVKGTGLSRLCATPSYTMAPEQRAAAIAECTERHRSQTAMANYAAQQHASSPHQQRRSHSSMSANVRGLAAAACRAIDDRKYGSPERRRRLEEDAALAGAASLPPLVAQEFETSFNAQVPLAVATPSIQLSPDASLHQPGPRRAAMEASGNSHPHHQGPGHGRGRQVRLGFDAEQPPHAHSTTSRYPSAAAAVSMAPASVPAPSVLVDVRHPQPAGYEYRQAEKEAAGPGHGDDPPALHRPGTPAGASHPGTPVGGTEGLTRPGSSNTAASGRLPQRRPPSGGSDVPAARRPLGDGDAQQLAGAAR